MRNYLKFGLAVSMVTNMYGQSPAEVDPIASAYCYVNPHHQSPCSPSRRVQEVTPCVRPTSDIFLSSPAYTFEMDGQVLFLQPTSNNLDYAAEAFPLPLLSPDWRIFNVDTDYHVGFDIGLKGIFHDAHTNIQLNWEHFHSSDSSSKQVPEEDMVGPLFEIGPDASAYSGTKGKTTFTFDAADLDYGLFISLGNRMEMNWFTGVGFLCLKQNLQSKFLSADGLTGRTIFVPSNFLGAGPQMGMDFCYRIAKGFQLVGASGVSCLVGRIENKTTYKSFGPSLTSFGVSDPNVQHTRVSNKTQVVPGFNGSLGLAYSALFCNCNMVKFEAGYEVKLYINAIQSVDMGSEVVTPPVIPDIIGVYARTFQNHLSNFALAGPYIKLDLGF